LAEWGEPGIEGFSISKPPLAALRIKAPRDRPAASPVRQNRPQQKSQTGDNRGSATGVRPLFHDKNVFAKIKSRARSNFNKLKNLARAFVRCLKKIASFTLNGLHIECDGHVITNYVSPMSFRLIFVAAEKPIRVLPHGSLPGADAPSTANTTDPALTAKRGRMIAREFRKSARKISTSYQRSLILVKLTGFRSRIGRTVTMPYADFGAAGS
jgi:hypothetical protein